MILISPARAREMDARTAQLWKVAGRQLMENAGAAVARAVRLTGASRVCVVAGAGNNGGDGAVAARHLLASGVDVRVHYPAGAPRQPGDAFDAYCALKASSPEALAEEAAGGSSLDRLRADLEWADVAVDALLGTGFAGAPHEAAAGAISLMNEHAPRIVAVDVPSGVDACTGHTPGQCVRACLTVSFGHAKLGMLLHPAAAAVGRIVVDHIGFPRRELEHDPSAQMIDPDSVRALLPARGAQMHKGDAGRVLVMAGSPYMPGAAALAAMACLRSGAGLTYLATAPAAAACAVALHPEIVTMASADAPAMASSVDAVVAGPGMGDTPATRAALCALMETLAEHAPGLPAVLDADALNCLEGDVSMLAEWSRRGVRMTLTPHPGELARLMRCSVNDIARDRAVWARRASEATGAVVALKGARTLVAAPNGMIAVNPTGNSGMATAGSGDVLAGAAGAMCAGIAVAVASRVGLAARGGGGECGGADCGGIGIDALFGAARAAVFCHGLAGDIAAQRRGARGMTAGDILDCLPDAFSMAEGDPAGLWKQMPCVPMSLFERW